MSAGKILVVDDEADIRTLLKEILSEEGYEVDVAADAAQARVSRARTTPDLVLLDIWMPDMDGITLLREWSAASSEDCPVVMMSGHGTVETAVEATRLGAFDFVEKPLSLAKLLRTVERALDVRQAQATGDQDWRGAAARDGRQEQAHTTAARGAHAYRPHDSALLLVGEPGSGREALARFVHEMGPRRQDLLSVWWPVRCPMTDAESRSWVGSREVRFTLVCWSRHRVARCSSSDLEDLAPRVQRLLLGVLETGGYRRVGGEQALGWTCA